MANFGTTEIEVGPSTSPNISSTSPGGVEAVAAVGFAAQVISIFDSASRRGGRGPTFGQMQKSNENIAVAEHLTRLSDITDAVNSNQMTSAQASTLANSNLKRMLSTHPQFAQALNSSHNAFVGKSGVGNVLVSGTVDEQRESAFIDKAHLAGAFNLSDSPEKQESDIETYRSTVAEVSAINAEIQQLTLSTAKVNLVAKKGTLEHTEWLNNNTRLKFSIEQRIGTVVTNTIPLQNNLYKRIAQDDTLSAEQKAINIEQTFAAYVNEIAVQGKGLDQATLDQYEARASRHKTIWLQVASNELGKVGAKNRLEEAIALETMSMVESDPAILGALALTRMGPVGGLVSAIPLGRFATKYFAELTPVTKRTDSFNAETSKEVEGDADGKKELFKDLVLPWMKRVTGLETTEEEGLETLEVVTNILKGIRDPLTATPDPDAYQTVLSYLADPASRAYLEKEGDVLWAHRTNAGLVLSRHLGETLLPAIQQEIQGVVGTEVVFENGVVRVTQPTPRGEGRMKRAIGVEKHLNTYIRAMSHLGGFSYEEFWETLKPVVVIGTPGVEEVDISDFNDIPEF